ncbi:hypothetical protein [Mycolicibacterium sp. A43C]
MADDHPGAGAEPEVVYRSYPTPKQLEAHTSMYKVAFEASVNALKTQVDEVNNIRQRLVAFLAFVGSTTGFLAGSALNATAGNSRPAAFYLLAGLATALVLVLIGYTIKVLAPSSAPLQRAANAKKIISGYIEVDFPTNEGHLLRNLALYNARGAEDNRAILADLRRKYVRAIGVGAVELVCLVALVWFFT